MNPSLYSVQGGQGMEEVNDFQEKTTAARDFGHLQELFIYVPRPLVSACYWCVSCALVAL